MFVRAIPDNKNGRDGYFCSLVESKRVNGVSKHQVICSLGFVPSSRLPYLKAAYGSGDPEEILKKEKLKLEDIAHQN